MAGESVVGTIGQVIKAVRGGLLPGEVKIVVDGFPHYFLAYSVDAIPSGAAVLVINHRGSRQIDVEPWSQPEADAENARRERS